MDALSHFVVVVVVFAGFISEGEKTTRKTDMKASLEVPFVCTYVQPCALRQRALPSAQNVCHPCELVRCGLHCCALNTPPKAAP